MADTATVSEVPVADRNAGLTDSIRAAFAGDAPLSDKVKALYKERPWATAALAGVAGIAILNTLRGKR